MDQQTLERRVELLEHEVDSLEKLPARMDALELQIVQLRQEMRDEFSAVRSEIRSGGVETRREMRELIKDTHTQMRVLHEDVVSRIAVLNEGDGGRKPRRSKR
jgi:hypothetical protein